MDFSPARTAREALEVLDRDGWCKGSVTLYRNSPYKIMIIGYGSPDNIIDPASFSYPDGSHCLGGAWNIALCGKPSFLKDCDEAYEPLISVILAQYPEIAETGLNRTSVILHFNDRAGTSEDDVRAILEKIACSEECPPG